MVMEPDRVKHLELIQGVVNRLAGNSFSVKGWSITLVAALFALASKDANALYAAIALLPALSFWALDGYYLHRERLFRRLYDRVRESQMPAVPDQSIPSAVPLFSMATASLDGVASWAASVRSKTLLGFHLPVVLAVFIVLGYVIARSPGPPAPRDETAAAIRDLAATFRALPEKPKTMMTPPSWNTPTCPPADDPSAHRADPAKSSREVRRGPMAK